jgi:type IV secretion system protein VirB10
MGIRAVVCVAVAVSAMLCAQAPPEASGTPQPGWQKNEGGAKTVEYVVEPGTRIPLNLINSVSTKHSAEGDRVYLETAFPILANGRIVIPPGSYVAGTLTEVKRPGRVKGRGEIYLRFDSLTLPNGVTRDFRARVGAVDGRGSETLDKKEGKIESDSSKSGDARTVGEAASTGASVGVIAGAAAGHAGMGAGIGAAAGAAAGILGVLLTRGPDVILAKGSTIEMVLDRAVHFDESDLDFTNSMRRVPVTDPGAPVEQPKRRPLPSPGIGMP